MKKGIQDIIIKSSRMVGDLMDEVSNENTRSWLQELLRYSLLFFRKRISKLQQNDASGSRAQPPRCDLSFFLSLSLFLCSIHAAGSIICMRRCVYATRVNCSVAVPKEPGEWFNVC